MKRFLIFIAILLFNIGILQADNNSTNDQKITETQSELKYSKMNLDQFKHILVLDEGRIKPIDTYAKNILLRLSGKSTYKRKPAVQWLAKVLFNSDEAENDKIFKINNKEILYAFNIELEDRNRYSFAQLKPYLHQFYDFARKAADKEAANRTIIEQEFMRVYENLNLYFALISYFDFVHTAKDFKLDSADARQKLNLPQARSYFSYYELNSIRVQLLNLYNKLKNKSGLSAADKEIMNLAASFLYYPQMYDSLSVKLLPGYEHKSEEWLNIWGYFNSGEFSEKQNFRIALLEQIAHYYKNADQESFDKAVTKYITDIHTELDAHNIRNKSSLEVTYNKLKPFSKAKTYYLLGFISIFLSFLLFGKLFRISSYSLIIIGLIYNITGVVLRMVIMNRPPVTNLFDTFIFISAFCVILGILLELYSSNSIGLITASLSGLVLMLISGKYAADGDTLKVLVAVLDSNFWLATHVITISMGYAGAIISGVVGHFFLIYKIIHNNVTDKLKSIMKMIYGTQAFGLIFTFVGTVLGGIWADQSWGRFWGWDPKENGALLIILWSSILFHARLSGIIKDTGFTIGSIFGIIVVMLAWFGINLLGVGLHSYGFSSGITYGLLIYIVLQLTFLTISGYLINKKITQNK